jgi:hypothetical protein
MRSSKPLQKSLLVGLYAVLGLNVAMGQQGAVTKAMMPARILGTPIDLPSPAAPTAPLLDQQVEQTKPGRSTPVSKPAAETSLSEIRQRALPPKVRVSLPVASTTKPPQPERGNLLIARGQRVNQQLKVWLGAQGIDLIWAAHGATPGHVRDVELLDDFESSTPDLKTALSEILGSFGLVAEISGNGQRVTVLNADNSAPQ